MENIWKFNFLKLLYKPEILSSFWSKSWVAPKIRVTFFIISWKHFSFKTKWHKFKIDDLSSLVGDQQKWKIKQNPIREASQIQKFAFLMFLWEREIVVIVVLRLFIFHDLLHFLLIKEKKSWQRVLNGRSTCLCLLLSGSDPFVLFLLFCLYFLELQSKFWL